jgi:hypothetical protein
MLTILLFTVSPTGDLEPSRNLVSLITTRRTPFFFAQRIVSKDIKSPHPLTKITSALQLSKAFSKGFSNSFLSFRPCKGKVGRLIFLKPESDESIEFQP